MRNIIRSDIDGSNTDKKLSIGDIFEIVSKTCPHISENDPAKLLKESFNKNGSVLPFLTETRQQYKTLSTSPLIKRFMRANQIQVDNVSIIYQEIIIQYESGFTVAVYQNIVHVYWVNEHEHEYYISNGEDFEVLN
jgi:hypothetical protein